MKKQSFYYLVYSLLSIFFVLFLSIDVNAAEVNVTNKIKYMTNFIGGTYGADDIVDGYNTIYGNYNVNTRYSGKLGYLYFYLSSDDYSFEKNHTYTITLNMATNDWRNNFMGPQVLKCNNDGSVQSTNSSLSVTNFRFVSKKQIKFNFKTNGTLSTYYKFVLYSNNYASQGGTAITGDSNWNLSSIIISDNVSTSSSSSTSGSSTPTPTATPSASNKDIIDNANQNTQDIISSVGESILNGASSIFDNANQNTTDIIDNANQNTQDIIDNQKNLFGNCYTNLLNPYSYIVSEGVRGYLVSLQEGETYTLLNTSSTFFGFKIGSGLYGYTDFEHWSPSSNKYVFTYHKNSNNTGNSYIFIFVNSSSLDLSNNDVVLTKGNYSGSFISYNKEVCSSKIDDSTNAIQEQTEVSRGILGKIGDIFNSIINLPVKIAEKLLDILKSLFIPDSEEFQDLINDFKDTMSEKLGVIYQAGDLIINIFTSIIDDDSPENACLTFPNISLPNGSTIIQEQQFCFSSVTEKFPVLLTLIRSLSGIFITITFINMLKKKYDDFINGGQL